MLDKNVAQLLNTQVNKEFYSAYLYLDFSNYYYEQGLEGFGNWYKVQAQEERDHAMLISQYLINNGGHITLDAIAKPDKKYGSFKDPLTFAAEHERYVTSLIHGIYTAAVKVSDYRTAEFLNWFVKEQGEEEKNADDMIKKYDLFGSDGKTLYVLDSELKSRSYSAPSLKL
ncbi:MAG TPA: ferritin [Treponema sp.]|nr:ferritin [Treponema sp.]